MSLSFFFSRLGFFLQYEWHIEGKWEGSIRTGDNRTKYEGEFEIPNLSDENDISEVTITFSVEKSKGDKLKEMMRKEGQVIVREKLAEYVRLLKEEFSQGLILPTKTTSNTQPITPPKTSINTSATTSLANLKISSNPLNELKDLKLQDTFKCTKVDLFRAFCDMEKVKAFTQNSVSKYDCKKGGFFSLLSDNVTGRFLDIVPYERVDMLWRFKSWPSDHYSHVSLTFHEETDQTKLVIQQTGVPAQFYDNTKVDLHGNILDLLRLPFFRKDGNDSTSKASNQHSAMVHDYFRLMNSFSFLFLCL